jgi:hypothetical protein
MPHHLKDLALGALFPMATHPPIVLRGMQRDWSLTYMHEKIFRVHLTPVARRDYTRGMNLEETKSFFNIFLFRL